MIRLHHATGLAAALCLATPCAAAPATDLSAYPELQITVLVPPIVEGLKRILPDPYSMRDLVVCPPWRVRFEDGRPVSWTVNFSLNSRGPAGGYLGTRTYAAGFKEGRISGHVLETGDFSQQGLAGVFNRMMEHKMANCLHIPDAQVQAIASVGQSKP